METGDLGNKVSRYLEYHSWDPYDRNTGVDDDTICITRRELNTLRDWLNTGLEPEDLKEILK